jgi:hypothetical protein
MGTFRSLIRGAKAVTVEFKGRTITPKELAIGILSIDDDDLELLFIGDIVKIISNEKNSEVEFKMLYIGEVREIREGD